jgi:hypothetical protein
VVVSVLNYNEHVLFLCCRAVVEAAVQSAMFVI